MMLMILSVNKKGEWQRINVGLRRLGGLNGASRGKKDVMRKIVSKKTGKGMIMVLEEV